MQTPELTDAMDKIREGLKKLEVQMAHVENWLDKRSTSHSQGRGKAKGSSKKKKFGDKAHHKKFGDKAHHGSLPCSFNEKPGKSLSRQLEMTLYVSNNKISCQLFVLNNTTSIHFLVDSEAQIPIIPATETDKKKCSH